MKIDSCVRVHIHGYMIFCINEFYYSTNSLMLPTQSNLMVTRLRKFFCAKKLCVMFTVA